MTTPIDNAEGLLNQWAMDGSGRIVHATECAIGATYACPLPGCRGTLRVVAVESDAVRAHLRHDDGCAHAGESPEHALAKRIVAQVFRLWLDGRGPLPWCSFFCSACSGLIPASLPLRGVTSVALEAEAAGRRVADVLLETRGHPHLAIEVLVTHAVDETKEADFAAAKVQWVELAAADVLARKSWRILAGSLRRQTACFGCTAKAAEQVAEDRKERSLRAAKTAELAAEERKRAAIAAEQQAVERERRAAEIAQAVAKMPGNEQQLQRALDLKKHLASVRGEIVADLRSLEGMGFARSEPPFRWSLPPGRFRSLSGAAREMAKRADLDARAYGVECPRCGERKLRVAQDKLFCFSCGARFEEET